MRLKSALRGYSIIFSFCILSGIFSSSGAGVNLPNVIASKMFHYGPLDLIQKILIADSPVCDSYSDCLELCMMYEYDKWVHLSSPSDLTKTETTATDLLFVFDVPQADIFAIIKNISQKYNTHQNVLSGPSVSVAIFVVDTTIKLSFKEIKAWLKNDDMNFKISTVIFIQSSTTTQLQCCNRLFAECNVTYFYKQHYWSYHIYSLTKLRDYYNIRKTEIMQER